MNEVPDAIPCDNCGRRALLWETGRVFQTRPPMQERIYLCGCGWNKSAVWRVGDPIDRGFDERGEQRDSDGGDFARAWAVANDGRPDRGGK